MGGAGSLGFALMALGVWYKDRLERGKLCLFLRSLFLSRKVLSVLRTHQGRTL